MVKLVRNSSSAYVGTFTNEKHRQSQKFFKAVIFNDEAYLDNTPNTEQRYSSKMHRIDDLKHILRRFKVSEDDTLIDYDETIKYLDSL